MGVPDGGSARRRERERVDALLAWAREVIAAGRNVRNAVVLRRALAARKRKLSANPDSPDGRAPTDPD